MKNNITEISNSLEFNTFVKEIKNRILKTQYEALKKLNKELIGLYLSIGEDIVNKQNQYGWGKSIVKKLSDELRKEFIGVKGFSVQNLWNMRQFYLEYKDNSKLQPLVRKIGWTKNVVIFQKCIGVSTYQTSKVLPTNLQQYLPNTQEIENNLMNFLEEKHEK